VLNQHFYKGTLSNRSNVERFAKADTLHAAYQMLAVCVEAVNFDHKKIWLDAMYWRHFTC